MDLSTETHTQTDIIPLMHNCLIVSLRVIGLSICAICYVTYLVWLFIVIVDSIISYGHPVCINDLCLLSYLSMVVVHQLVYMYIISDDNVHKQWHLFIQMIWGIIITMIGLGGVVYSGCSNTKSPLFLTSLVNVIIGLFALIIITVSNMYLMLCGSKKEDNTGYERI